MGRRHSIAAKKAAGDAGKSKMYALCSKIIQIAARKGADPKMNPSLELALSKARYHSVPRDIVDRAILKGSGQLEGDSLEEIFYEGYGPAGSALVIRTLTGNSNRTATNTKTILHKFGGSFGLQNSVIWQFDENGVILVDGKTKKEFVKGKDVETVLPLDQNQLEEEIMELDINDLSIEDDTAVILTEKTNFALVLGQVEALGYHVVEADLQFLPQNPITLEGEDLEQLQRLLDALDNDEDIDRVWTNVN
ncbi:MAG: YebC/PmpR family DNA-binding transcriptional regulator [Candidatus Absconditabacteria bacterium]